MLKPNLFLQKVATDLRANHGQQWEEVLCLVPTQAAKGAFLSLLTPTEGRPMWGPRVATLEEWAEEASPLFVGEKIVLLKRLHGLVKTFTEGYDVPFSSFAAEGEMMLRHLDELKIYDYKGKWLQGAGEEVPSIEKEVEVRMMSKMDLLRKVGPAFDADLLEDGIAYRGLLFQDFYERLVRGAVTLPFRHLVVVEGRFLPPLFAAILGWLQGRLSVAAYYDGASEEGMPPCFQKEKKAIIAEKGRQSEGAAEVEVVATNTEVGQVARAVEQVASWREEGVADGDIAVVMANPSLLVALLHGFPADFPLVYTLRLPLKQMPLLRFIVDVLTFRLKWQQREGVPALLKRVEGLFATPYAPQSQEGKEAVKAFLRGEKKLNRAHFSPLWYHLLAPIEGGVWAFLQFLCDHLKGGWVKGWVLVLVDEIIEEVALLEGYMGKSEVLLAEGDFIPFLERWLGKRTIPLVSKEREGIHLLDVASLSLLGYGHIAFLSANEGIFPATHQGGGILTPGFRKAHGLPTGAKSAEGEHVVDTLLHYAKEVLFLYNGGDGSEEKSRYLWKYEGQGLRTEGNVLQGENPLPIRVTKGEKGLSSFLVGGKRPLTPSTVNSYLRCPLHFFYDHIIRLGGVYEPLEEVAVIGRVFHRVMELLYRDYREKRVGKREMAIMQKRAAKVLDYVLRQGGDYDEALTPWGGATFVRGLVESLVGRFLKSDGGLLPFEVVGVEVGKGHKLVRELTLTDGQVVRLGGIIDRIDRYEGGVRVIDYKTGSFYPFRGEVGALFDGAGGVQHPVAFQLMWYGWLYSAYTDDPVLPMVSSKEGLSVIGSGRPLGGPNGKEGLAAFEAGLRGVLDSLFDREKPYEQTEDRQICSTCPYRVICER